MKRIALIVLIALAPLLAGCMDTEPKPQPPSFTQMINLERSCVAGDQAACDTFNRFAPPLEIWVLQKSCASGDTASCATLAQVSAQRDAARRAAAAAVLAPQPTAFGGSPTSGVVFDATASLARGAAVGQMMR